MQENAPSEAMFRGYPKSFWTANGVEILERAAYYGMFIALTLYLTSVVGFTDVEAGWIGGLFAGFLYFAPTFAGAAADALGFRRSLLLAFAALTVGYLGLGLFTTRTSTLVSLGFILVGGAMVKPTISGTVARCSSEATRARAFSIYYLMVNIGSFTGKTVARPLRTDVGLTSIPLFSAALCLVGLGVLWMLYKNPDRAGEGKSLGETWDGFVRVLKNFRFMALIVIVGGFWAIQQQLYATLPKYVLRVVGDQAAPEWYANVNPLVVVLLVVPVTTLVRRLTPVASIGIALAIIPVSALLMSLSPWLASVAGPQVHLGVVALHPVTVMMVVGIATQGLAECFLSPRYMEYASRQAPPGETALYMGYSNLCSFFGNILGFGISGYLLDAWCPDPAHMDPAVAEARLAALRDGRALPEAWANAHYIWYVFAGIGALAFLALLVFRMVTEGMDRRRAR